MNRDANKIDVDYYVKPTNKQLFLHFRSNHTKHVFRALVYNQALLAVTVCSRVEWAARYLETLKGKFLEQEYPLDMINQQFERALQLNRNDLINKKKNKNKNDKNKRKMKNCLVVTGNPGNPPFYKWIKDLLPILHKDKRLKKLVPDISVVIKQPQNVGSFAIRAKHWKVPTFGDDTTQPGCFRLHQPHICI